MMLGRLTSWTGALAVTLTVACSDPAELPAQGAYTISFGQPEGTGTCPLSIPPYSQPAGQDAFNAILKGEDDPRLVDGDTDVDVSCTVSGEDSFTVNGRLRSRFASFTVDGTVSGDTGTATITETHPDTGGNFVGEECSLSVRFINQGAIFANYNCGTFARPPTTCGVTGTFILENCD